MKKLFLIFAVAFIALNFTSCSKEEEKNGTNPTTSTPAEEVVGNYVGNLSVKINDIEPIVSEKTIEVEKVSDNTINLNLKDFSIEDPTSGATVNVGDIKLSNVELVGESAPYTFTAEETLQLDVFGTGAPMEIPVKAESGKFENNTLATTLSISILNGVMNIAVEFEGTK